MIASNLEKFEMPAIKKRLQHTHQTAQDWHKSVPKFTPSPKSLLVYVGVYGGLVEPKVPNSKAKLYIGSGVNEMFGLITRINSKRIDGSKASIALKDPNNQVTYFLFIGIPLTNISRPSRYARLPLCSLLRQARRVPQHQLASRVRRHACWILTMLR
jgi:hypothetical protein